MLTLASFWLQFDSSRLLTKSPRGEYKEHVPKLSLASSSSIIYNEYPLVVFVPPGCVVGPSGGNKDAGCWRPLCADLPQHAAAFGIELQKTSVT